MSSAIANGNNYYKEKIWPESEIYDIKLYRLHLFEVFGWQTSIDISRSTLQLYMKANSSF